MGNPTFIRTRGWDVYRVTGTIVDGRLLDYNYPNQFDRYAVVSYSPVRHHLTPSAYIPAEGRPYVVTVSHRADYAKGFHISYNRRFKTLAAALKFMATWAR